MKLTLILSETSFRFLQRMNNKAMIAINSGDPQKIADEVNSLIRMVNMKASYTAEREGWYSELEQFIDSLPLE